MVGEKISLATLIPKENFLQKTKNQRKHWAIFTLANIRHTLRSSTVMRNTPASVPFQTRKYPLIWKYGFRL